VLERLTGRTVVNAGVPGEVSAEALRRLPRVLAEAAPDLLILCTGGNDFLRRQSSAALERNLRAMVAAAREAGVPVVLVGVPAFGLFLDTAEVYHRVAEDLEVPMQDDILGELLGDNRYKSDHVHPNAAGYRLMAEAIAALLEAHGAL